MSDAGNPKPRVVLVDRDGVINHNIEGDYVRTVEEFEFLPGALKALRRLRLAGWEVVVISNQAGVGKGLMQEETLQEIDRVMMSGVSAAGGRIRASYYCTHLREDCCDCRKPAPGLILRAGQEIGFDPREAFLVGDSFADVQAGQAAGCRTAAVLSGRMTVEEAASMDPPPDCVVADLSEAVDWIISTET